MKSASDFGADLSSSKATLLADGRVLFEGGMGDAWLYDPARGVTIIGPMHVGRSGNTATLLNDGRVLITGGANDEKWAASAELFTIGPASSASPAPSASATPSAAPTRTPGSGGVFFQTGSMLSGRGDYAASTLLADGRVLVTGRYSEPADPTTEIYDPKSGLWSEGSSMVYGRFGHTATLLQNGKVLIAGCTTSKKAELYDPATGKFKVTGTTRVLTCYQTAVLLADGRVLIAGGANNGTYLKSAEIYDPATGTFSTTGSMNEARADARAVLLPDGRVLIAGGDRGSNIMDAMFLGSAEIYDPATGKFTPTGSMKDKRTLFCAMLLADGKVLVAGGARFYDGEIVEAAETYDPATGRFTPLDSLAGAGGNELDDMWAVLLHDGRVLFSGSADGGVRSILYDPTSGKLSLTAALPDGGSMPPVVLRDGRVLIPGQPSLLYVP